MAKKKTEKVAVVQFIPGDRYLNFVRINRRISELHHQINLYQGISESGDLLLRSIIFLGNGCTQKDICDLTYLSKQTVNSSLRKLTRDGLILTRPGLGRSVKLYLTVRGEELVKAKLIPALQLEDSVLESMENDDSEKMQQLLESFYDRYSRQAEAMIGSIEAEE